MFCSLPVVAHLIRPHCERSRHKILDRIIRSLRLLASGNRIQARPLSGFEQSRQPWISKCLSSLATLLIAYAVLMGNVAAQSVEAPFSNPVATFERLFEEDLAEDRAALDKVAVSFEDEQKLGDELVQSALASLKEADIKVETTGRDVEYLQSLVDTLRPYMRNKTRYKTIRVIFAESRRVDARSYPGGTLIFFEGLLDVVDNEAALAGIVGHELSHLDRGHQLLPIKRMKLMEKSLSSRDLAQFFSSQSAITRLWARPFRPEDERDADHDGVAWSFAAGYDPREMARLFQALEKKSSAGKMNDVPWATFFRSHPYNAERKAAIMKQFQMLNQSPSKHPHLYIGRENLLARRSRQQMEQQNAQPK